MAEQNNKTKRQLQGVVVSDKMEKTITVQVSTYKADPIYKKRVAYFKKYKAHDESKKPKLVIQSLSKKLVTFQKTSTSV